MSDIPLPPIKRFDNESYDRFVEKAFDKIDDALSPKSIKSASNHLIAGAVATSLMGTPASGRDCRHITGGDTIEVYDVQIATVDVDIDTVKREICYKISPEVEDLKAEPEALCVPIDEDGKNPSVKLSFPSGNSIDVSNDFTVEELRPIYDHFYKECRGPVLEAKNDSPAAKLAALARKADAVIDEPEDLRYKTPKEAILTHMARGVLMTRTTAWKSSKSALSVTEQGPRPEFDQFNSTFSKLLADGSIERRSYASGSRVERRDSASVGSVERQGSASDGGTERRGNAAKAKDERFAYHLSEKGRAERNTMTDRPYTAERAKEAAKSVTAWHKNWEKDNPVVKLLEAAHLADNKPPAKAKTLYRPAKEIVNRIPKIPEPSRIEPVRPSTPSQANGKSLAEAYKVTR